MKPIPNPWAAYDDDVEHMLGKVLLDKVAVPPDIPKVHPGQGNRTQGMARRL